MERALFAYERMMLAGGLPYTSMLVLRVHAAIERDEIENALRALQRRHKLLRAAVVERAGREWFVEAEEAPRIGVRIVPRMEEDGWKAELARELAEPLDRARGPLARLLWVRGAEASELVMTTDHAICDGRSVVMLGRELVACLAGAADELPEAPAPETLDALFGTARQFSRVQTLLIRLVGTSYVRVYVALRRLRRGQHRSASLLRAPHYALAWDLDRDVGRALTRRAAREGVSAYEAMATALLETAKTLFADGSFGKLVSPIDLRPFLALDARNMLFPIPGHVTLELAPATPGFWETARALRADAAASRAKLRPARTARLSELLHGAVGVAVDAALRGKARAAMAFTNLGDAVFPELGGQPVEALAVLGEAPWAASTNLVVLRSTGRWRFCLTARDITLPREDAERFVARAMEKLRLELRDSLPAEPG